MRCPRCGCQEDRVIDSRASKDGAAVRRRRECAACGHRFTTHEEIIQAELKFVKRDNSREDFDPNKIRAGIEKACWKRDVKPEAIDMIVSQVTSGLEADYEREVPSSEVGTRTMVGCAACHSSRAHTRAPSPWVSDCGGSPWAQLESAMNTTMG